MESFAHVFLGSGETPQYIDLGLANRHGLIAGATGTGKTVTLQVMAEGFSAAGVPVFMADVKGDLSGISLPGHPSPKLDKRLGELGIASHAFTGFPTVFWDLFGEKGHPVRATVSDMGPLLLAQLLELNDTQEGILNIVFRLADEEGMLLLDFKDLRSLLNWTADNAKQLRSDYGGVHKNSVGAVQRRLLVLEQQGADAFFGEPALMLDDLIRTDLRGYGHINILAADNLMQSPRLYSTFMLWLLSELFEELPEVGDPDKPKLVFFFDEAHLLFDTAPKALLEKVEQVVRLIRSKGVGIYFVTQNPTDIPDDVLGQLGNRVQHALRAFTPRDQKAAKVAAETLRPNPAVDAIRAITEMGVGEALVSTLREGGVPSPVERTLIRPPYSRMGPASTEERSTAVARSPFSGKYDHLVDRESAYEILRIRAEQAEQVAATTSDGRESQRESSPTSGGFDFGGILTGTGRRQGVLEAMAKSAARSIGSSVGRQIVRGLMGSLFRRR